MNTRDLQYFAMLVKLKNYTQVAKYFNVSQPSITQAIRRLEQEFDTKLVRKDRVHRDEMITRSGQLLYEKALAINKKNRYCPSRNSTVRSTTNKIRSSANHWKNVYFTHYRQSF